MNRSSRCSGNEELTIYLNGIPFERGNRKDNACENETHLYTTSTTLIPPVTYEWSLDGIVPLKPLLGSGPTFSYTFDDKQHTLFLVARSTGSQCGIQIDMKVTGHKCLVCPIKCVTESVFIPGGSVIALIDDKGNNYPVSGNTYFECSVTSNANLIAREAILKTIRDAAGCQTESLQVLIQHNFSTPNCMNLMIQNSPIKIAFIKIGTLKYSFYTGNC